MAGRTILRARPRALGLSQACSEIGLGRRAFASPAPSGDNSSGGAGAEEAGKAKGASAADVLLQEFANFKKQYKGAFRNVAQPTYLKAERRDQESDSRKQDIPFQSNALFRSRPIVSIAFREEVYKRVIVEGKSVRLVSSQLGITMERVAAIARMMAIQKQWESEGKKTVTFLDKAIHTMVPTTELPSSVSDEYPHESINDLPEHPATASQLFVPVPESRSVNRTDAGAIFGLPPADDLIPHPELLISEKEKQQGVSTDERKERADQRDQKDALVRMAESRARILKERQGVEIAERGRWRWRLKDGKVGEIGARYGVPHQDRKKGHIKIPTRIV